MRGEKCRVIPAETYLNSLGTRMDIGFELRRPALILTYHYTYTASASRSEFGVWSYEKCRVICAYYGVWGQGRDPFGVLGGGDAPIPRETLLIPLHRCNLYP